MKRVLNNRWPWEKLELQTVWDALGPLLRIVLLDSWDVGVGVAKAFFHWFPSSIRWRLPWNQDPVCDWASFPLLEKALLPTEKLQVLELRNMDLLERACSHMWPWVGQDRERGRLLVPATEDFQVCVLSVSLPFYFECMSYPSELSLQLWLRLSSICCGHLVHRVVTGESVNGLSKPTCALSTLHPQAAFTWVKSFTLLGV